jgi:Lon protease-like protein
LAVLLPLFPLELVLLPGVPQPLHIFEPRYKQMIGDCLAEKKVFGIVRSHDEGISEIGCTAEIITVAKKYPDGRMDILTEGRRRFQVMEVNQEMPFLRAEIMLLDEEPEHATPAETAQAAKLHGEIMALAGESSPEFDLKDPQLSFQLAGSLPLDLDFKQSLLSMGSEAKRIPAVVAYLEAILPNLKRSLHVRQKAGGNGHAL